MIKTKSSRPGFTLVETLVTILLFLLIAGILFMMIVKSKTAMQSAVTRSSSRQDLQVVFWKIAQEIRYSDVAYITDGSVSGLKAFSFISAQDSANKFILNADGTPNWQKYVIYYVPSGADKVLRKEIYADFKTPGALIPLSQAQLSAELNGTGAPEASSVTAMSLKPSTAGQASAYLTIETQAQNQHGKLDKQSMQMMIYILN